MLKDGLGDDMKELIESSYFIPVPLCCNNIFNNASAMP